ncbi:MAG: hypothetical protein ACRDTC_12995 [Pseudonocardiaceae bacterium]
MRGLIATGVIQYKNSVQEIPKEALPEVLMLDLIVDALWPIVIAPEYPGSWHGALVELTSLELASFVSYARAAGGGSMDKQTFYSGIAETSFAGGILNLLYDLSSPRGAGSYLTTVAVADGFDAPPMGSTPEKSLRWIYRGAGLVAGTVIVDLMARGIEDLAGQLWYWLTENATADGRTVPGESDVTGTAGLDGVAAASGGAPPGMGAGVPVPGGLPGAGTVERLTGLMGTKGLTVAAAVGAAVVAGAAIVGGGIVPSIVPPWAVPDPDGVTTSGAPDPVASSSTSRTAAAMPATVSSSMTTAPGGSPGGSHSTTAPTATLTGDPSSTPPPPPTVSPSWGFGFVRWPDDPIGTSHDLSAANEESNWTFGLWRLTSPAPPGNPTVTHLAVGQHRVRLPGIGMPGGIVQVTATDFSSAGSFCQPYGWGQDGADEVIDVACFDSAGGSADVPFGVVFIAGSADNPLSPGGVRGFAYADRPDVATYTPDPIHRRNMGVVTRLGTGRYTVAVPDSGDVIEISPVGAAARHCAIADRRTATVEVACATHGGGPADTAFTISSAGGQNLLDDRRAATGNYLISADAPDAAAPSVSLSWSSGGGSATLARQSTGRYEIHFPSGLLPSSTHVTATGGGYCNMPLRNDIQSDNVVIRIACFTATGAPSNSGFHLIYMSARI